MIYVALLRGINVGGNNKVSMSQLKKTFEQCGFSDVTTYINSGNVIFSDTEHQPEKLASIIELAIEKDFGFEVKVLIRDQANIEMLNKKVPQDWVNNSEFKTDIMFLWKAIDSPKILEQIVHKPELETLQCLPGALVWHIERKNVTKSPILRMVGTPLYKQMTIRNVNTLRKLNSLMSS